ncbi:peptidoglycan DD-metalloendopeptidase family protein [Faecalicatena contorta]|uniref:peptidoglycan DD-metalloendopeptidase family protein n=1 Tax=Faecalicatena contorta TaxID=39482 RepID=UPI001F3DBF66|nr:peptidoglycan DD-metalloendopeptidase family protein [Faecalicatena contorta]MCF2669320.1 peptidoglycan DD-metalloendopeptidase family protein [Faecalicatena contorta]
MKHHRFLLSLAKVGVITIITIGLVCTTIQKASALTEETEVESVTSENSEAQNAENSGAAEVKPSDSENASDSGNIIDSGEVSDPEEGTDSDDANVPEDITDSDETSDPGDSTDSDETSDPEDGTDTSESSEAEDSKDSNEVSNSEDVSDSNEVSGSEDVSDSNDGTDSSESSKTEDKNNGSDSHQTSDAKPNLSTQSEKTTSPKATIRDESSDALYIKRSYNPSETFVELNKRIKYNAALPLDNIPSFITQEMIIAALKCQDETGYPASVTIAQIIQESGFGKYGPGGEDHQGLSYLAYQYCNLFGVKGTGTAGSVSMRTGEQTSSGKYYTTTADFRVYNTYTECIEDRTKLIKRAYSDLISGVTDANTFAARIGSRWATSLQYSQHLIQQMERYDLYRLDRMTLLDFSEMIGQFSDPCPGSYLTSSFGYRDFDHKFHKGIDLGTNGEILPVYAAESGTVIKAEYDNLAGNWILIDHGNGLTTKYMHFSHTFVKEGQEVTKGQQIGLTGTTGRSTGIHLHFQVEENGVAVNPTTYLSTEE